jgi:hypothetical protein
VEVWNLKSYRCYSKYFFRSSIFFFCPGALPVAQRAQPVAPRHAHVPGAMRALPTSMSRAQTRPAPSCTILHHPAAWPAWSDQFWRAIPKFARPGFGWQARAGQQVAMAQVPGIAMNFLHLPTSSYLDVHFSLSVVYKSLSKHPNFRCFLVGLARAKVSILYPKIAREPNQNNIFFARKPAE